MSLQTELEKLRHLIESAKKNTAQRLAYEVKERLATEERCRRLATEKADEKRFESYRQLAQTIAILIVILGVIFAIYIQTSRIIQGVLILITLVWVEWTATLIKIARETPPNDAGDVLIVFLGSIIGLIVIVPVAFVLFWLKLLPLLPLIAVTYGYIHFKPQH